MEEQKNRNEKQYDDEQHDDGQHDEKYKKIEEAILSIIGKIKKDRNRVCVQNFHTFVNRPGITVAVDIVKQKVLIEDLIASNIIVDEG